MKIQFKKEKENCKNLNILRYFLYGSWYEIAIAFRLHWTCKE
jgi:hypothetical protein